MSCPSSPSMRGMDGPQMSMSSRPTCAAAPRGPSPRLHYLQLSQNADLPPRRTAHSLSLPAHAEDAAVFVGTCRLVSGKFAMQRQVRYAT